MLAAPISTGQQARLWGLAVAIALTASCFDSDEKARAATEGTTSGTTLVTDSAPPDPWTTGQGGSVTSESGPPDATCRDAIDCIWGCAGELQMMPPGPEPDLSCFLECEKGLDEEEALALLHLAECVAKRCVDLGICDSGSDTGTGTGDTTGTSTSAGSTAGPAVDPCLDCILTHALDPQPPGCLEEAANCD